MSFIRPGKILGTFKIPEDGDYSLDFLKLLEKKKISLDPSDEGVLLWEGEGSIVRSCGTREGKNIIEYLNKRENTVTVIQLKEFPQQKKEIELMGTAEIGKMLGWSSKKVSVYRQRGKLPQPVYQLKMGPIWNKEDIERWALEKGLIKKTISFYSNALASPGFTE